MKISKLFHWLYAVLMFLPLVMFLPSCLYYSFNEHATNTETTTINYKYQSNEVNSLDDLVEGNIYSLETLDIYPLSEVPFSLKIYSCYSIDIINGSYYDDEMVIYEYANNDNNFLLLNFDYNSAFLQFTNNQGYVDLAFDSPYEFVLNDIIFSIVEDGYNTLSNFKYYLTQDEYPLPQYTDYNVIDSVSVNTDDTITDKVATAWESIWNLPLFAWTQNSFVSAPFTYITGLFGLQANNSLNYVFTYFCSISICWLVFDLLMYVPNLAHRWLDKGAIE